MSVAIVADHRNAKPGDLSLNGGIYTSIGKFPSVFPEMRGEISVLESCVHVYEAFGWYKTDRPAENGIVTVYRG